MSLDGKFIILLNEGFKYEIRFESEGFKSTTLKLDTRDMEGFHKKEEHIKLKPL